MRCCVLSCAGELSSARHQAVSLSEVAAAGEALRHELEGELQETQQQLAQLTATLTNSNAVREGWVGEAAGD